MNYEQEEEFLTNDLSRKLAQVSLSFFPSYPSFESLPFFLSFLSTTLFPSFSFSSFLFLSFPTPYLRPSSFLPPLISLFLSSSHLFVPSSFSSFPLLFPLHSFLPPPPPPIPYVVYAIKWGMWLCSNGYNHHVLRNLASILFHVKW